MGSTVRALRAAKIWALLIIAVAILGVIVWQQRDSNTPSGPAATSSTTTNSTVDPPDSSVVDAATERLERAWGKRDRDAFVAAAGDTPAAQSWGAQTYDSLNALGVKSFDLSINEGPASAMAVVRGGTDDVTAEVTWTPGASSGLPNRRTDPVRVKLQVRPTEQGAAIESAQPTDDPMPLWLEGALSVVRRDAWTAVRINGGSEEPKLQEMLTRAMADVRQVYGQPEHDLFVVLPSEVSQSSDITGTSESRLAQLAAITTSLDGSTSSRAPVAVVLNPGVFTPMNPRAAQIVLTHEATHEVTGAATAVVPLWVAEGYADYVALSHDRLRPTRSASQVLARVRKQGPRKNLPADDAFAASSRGLGATYEGAWMAFRMLGETYEDATIAGFYRQVLDGRSVDVAARRVFGRGIDDITARWRDYLRAWAADPR